jgi:hypothetical protein
LKDHILNDDTAHWDEESAVSTTIAINGDSRSRAWVANSDIYKVWGVVDDR